jgi:hypothetical protein
MRFGGLVCVKVGYAGGSDRDADLAAQRAALVTVGCEKIFEDRGMIDRHRRPGSGLEKALKEVTTGDVLVVSSLKCLGPSIGDIADQAANTAKSELSEEIEVQLPKETDWVLGFTIYWSDPLRYKITRWTDDLVEADYEASGALTKQCRNTKLQLNFKAKEYYMICTNTGEQCEIMGIKLDPLTKPRVSKDRRRREANSGGIRCLSQATVRRVSERI